MNLNLTCQHYLRELADSGRPTIRTYLSLYVGDKGGKIQILLHARAIDVVDQNVVQSLAKARGAKFERKSSAGPGEIVIDGHKFSASYTESLTALAQAITVGWKAKTVGQNQPEPTAESKATEIIQV